MTDFATARRKMVDCQVRPSDVTDLRVIDAMLQVPREAFAPEVLRAQAYLDAPLDLSPLIRAGSARAMMKPATLAVLLQAARIDATSKVLVAGCGTGYSAAVAAAISRHVHAVEPDADLAAFAQDAWEQCGCAVEGLHIGPIGEGDGAHAFYDVIVLDGAIETWPETLLRQLADGGRLVGVFADQTPARLLVVTRSGDDFGNRMIGTASEPRLPGFAKTPQFVF